MVALRGRPVISPISPIVVCGPRLRNRIVRPSPRSTTMPIRPSRMKCIEAAGSPSRAMIRPAGTSSRRQYSASRSACAALPNASDHHARNDRASSAAVRCASMMLLLAVFQRAVEIGRDDDVVGNEPRGAKGAFQFRRQIDEHDPRSARGRCLLDLRKTVRRRRIDAGDETEIENQKPAVRLRRQQRLDVLIEPIGRTEEQIALQRHALNLPAVSGQQRQLVRPAIERGAVFRSVEIEFDRVNAACA